MGKNDQIINYLSVSALEKVGLNEPVQSQLDCLERSLTESLQWLSLAIYVLAEVGDVSPTVARVKSLSQGLFELLQQAEKTQGLANE